MRRFAVIVTLGALLSMIGGATAATPALAGGRGDGWTFQDFFPGFTTDNCGFPINATQDVDKVFSKVLKTADGSTVFLFTGSAKITFTNPANGKNVSVNTSGPAKLTVNADNSGSFRATGREPMDLVPADAARFRLPALFASSGPITGTFDTNGNLTSLSLQGHIHVNICAALG